MRRAEAGIQVDKFYPPTDWQDSNNKQIDIRKNAENNSIVLLVGVKSDFSAYKLLGLYAIISSGTYDVYIDDVLVGSAVTSNTQYDIDFSTIATSYGTATTPEALVLHKVVIKPTTEGATITTFSCRRTTGTSGYQSQGIIWVHYELQNDINIQRSLSQYGSYFNSIIYCVSAKGNNLSILNATSCFYAYSPTKLTDLPKIKFNDSSTYAQVETFMNNPNLKRVIFENLKDNNEYYPNMNDNKNIEQILANKSKTSNIKVVGSIHKNNYKLKMINNIDLTKVTSMQNFLTNAQNLYPTKLDVSKAVGLTSIGTYGTSTYPMRGLRGLKVSNEAPFSGTSPQIDVSYTGLDRDALVELFNSLPAFMPLTVEGSPTINNGVVSDFSADDYLQLPQFIDYNSASSWEIKMTFTTGSDVNTAQALYHDSWSNGGVYINIVTNRIRPYVNFGDGDYYGYPSGTILANTKYYCRFLFTGTQYKILLSTDDVNWIDYLVYDDSKKVANQSLKLGRIGISNRFSTQNFLGSIDIPNSYIKLNTTKYNFLLPSATTRTLKCVGATGNNLTVVGTPTIDENGVASGFDSSNYLSRTGINFKQDESFECVVCVSSSNVSTIETFVNSYGLIIRKIYSKAQAFVRKDGTQREILGTTTLVNNQKYWIKVKYTKSKVELYLSIDGANYNLEAEREISIDTSNNNTLTLSCPTGTYWLEDFYLKQGDNYTIKGYLTDNDKNIALNKGWALTLS